MRELAERLLYEGLPLSRVDPEWREVVQFAADQILCDELQDAVLDRLMTRPAWTLTDPLDVDLTVEYLTDGES